MTRPVRAVLRVVCQDRPGLVADVSALLFRIGANVIHADQHMDPEVSLFFQRVEFSMPGELSPGARAELAGELRSACERWNMTWSLRFSDERRRMALLVSKHPHCAMDVLARHRADELRCEIPIVISNHPDLGEEITRRGYNFVHEPIRDGDKAGQEARIQAHLERERIELVVLARYMQILTPELVGRWPERIINIHHSFLPAFIGAEPYRQAYRRGVKLIGATSHYVTAVLDDGPIIAQQVTRVGHRDTVEDMVRKGRDLERVVFAEAVRCHLEDRVIVYGNKTVVFE